MHTEFPPSRKFAASGMHNGVSKMLMDDYEGGGGGWPCDDISE